jgi:tetratricopeptide (TPR) repeat protein
MWFLLLILSAVFLVHAPSIDNEYVYDDRFSAMPTIDGHPHPMVAELQPISEYFTSHYLRGANETSRGYRPVTVYSYALVHDLVGRSLEASEEQAGNPKAAETSAQPQHVLNVLLQVINTWLVWLLLVRVAGRGWPTICGTAVFGLHAIHSGPIASIVGRGELLAFAFGAAAALLYLSAVRRASLRRADMLVRSPFLIRRGLLINIGLLLASSVLLFLSFCSKESGLAWAFFLPCLRLARHWGMSAEDDARQPRLLRDFLLWLAVAIPAIAFFLWLYVRTVWHLDYLPSYLSNPLLHDLPDARQPWVRLMSAPMIWVYGLYKVLAPFSLCCNYSPNTFTLVHELTDLRLIGAVLVLLGVLGGGLWFARRQPLLFLAMASFLGFSFVISNVPFGLETIFAERLYYTPSLGLSFLVAWLMQRKWKPVYRWLLWVAIAGWLVASTWTTYDRMGVWQENYTLFTHDVEVQPRSLSLLQIAAGEHLKNRPRPNHKKHKECIERILEVEPRFIFGLKARAKELVGNGDLDGALEVLQRGLNSPLLMIVDKANDVPHLNHDLGVLLLAKGRREEARKRFQDSLDFAPNYHPARERLLRLALEDGDLDKAEELLAEGTKIDSEHDPWKIFSGVLAYRRGDYQTAAKVLDDILPRAPRERTVFTDWLALADSLARIGRRRDGLYRLEQRIQVEGIPPQHEQAVVELRKRLQ